MPFFSEAKYNSFFDNIFLALQNFFIIFLLIVYAWRKSMQEKKMGVTVLIFEIREAKGHFEGKLLRLVVLKLSTSICQMKFKHAKSESVKLPYT